MQFNIKSLVETRADVDVKVLNKFQKEKDELTRLFVEIVVEEIGTVLKHLSIDEDYRLPTKLNPLNFNYSLNVKELYGEFRKSLPIDSIVLKWVKKVESLQPPSPNYKSSLNIEGYNSRLAQLGREVCKAVEDDFQDFKKKPDNERLSYEVSFIVKEIDANKTMNSNELKKSINKKIDSSTIEYINQLTVKIWIDPEIEVTSPKKAWGPWLVSWMTWNK